jgi:hypothetical protein
LSKDSKRLLIDELKTEASRRTLPLVNPMLWEILRRRLDDGRRLVEPLPVANSERHVDDLVFINKKGEPVGYEAVWKANKALLKRAGLPI